MKQRTHESLQKTIRLINFLCYKLRVHTLGPQIPTQVESVRGKGMTIKESRRLPHPRPSFPSLQRVSFPFQQGQDRRRVQAALQHEYKWTWSLLSSESSRKLGEEE